MKNKQLEKIEPQLLIKRKNHKNTEAKCEIVEVGGEEILLVNIYKTEYKELGNKMYPNYRFFCSHTDYATQKSDGSWTSSGLDRIIGNDYWGSSLFHPEKPIDGEIIKKFLPPKQRWNAEPCYMLGDHISDIRNKRSSRKYELRATRCNNMQKLISPLPADLDKWLKDDVMKNRYIFYKTRKDGKQADAHCSYCESDIVYDRKKEKPKHNSYGICPKCKETVRFISEGLKNIVVDEAPAVVMQKTDQGFVSRYFTVTKNSYPDGESIAYHEDVRAFYNGQRLHEYFGAGYGSYGQHYEQRWWDSNGYGYNWGTATLYTKNLARVLQGTKWQYSCLEKYARVKAKAIKHECFMKAFEKMPFIEYFIKLGLYKLVDELIEKYDAGTYINLNGKNPMEILKINKQRINRLVQDRGGFVALTLLQIEEQEGKIISDEQIEFITWKKITIENIKFFTSHMTIARMVNYLKKAAQIIKNYSKAETTWKDYIKMAISLNMDISDDIVLFPKKLEEEHNKLAETVNKEVNKEKMTKANEQYANIAKMAEELNKKFGFEDEEFFIRAPEDAAEIIKEGQILHHCVGGESYIPYMNKKETFILFLRKKNCPDVPFYTIQITGKEILQYHGAFNRDIDKNIITSFIGEFKKRKLRKRKSEAA